MAIANLEVYATDKDDPSHKSWRPATAAEKRLDVMPDSGVPGYGVLTKWDPKQNASHVIARCRFDLVRDAD